MTIKTDAVGDMLASHLISLMHLTISKAGVEDGARLFLVLSGDRTRNNSHKLKYKEFHLNMKENIEGGRVLEESAQGGCGISLSGDIQNPPGCFCV